MNPDLLLKHFNRISASPNAIPRLRSFILDLAVRGRLVEQDSKDESASELLKRNQAAKIKRGRIERPRKETAISKDGQNFLLPIGWVWASLADLVTVLNGRAYSQNELLNEGTPVLRVGNLFTSQHWYYSTLELDEDKYCDEGDLIFAWSASFGPFIWRGPKVIYHYHIWKLAFHSERDIDKFYLYRLLLQKTQEIKESGHGISMLHMTKEKMEKLQVPLPPLAEQRRIVAKADELMALCDGLEAANAERESRRDRLAAASHHRLNNGANTEAFHNHANFYVRHLPSLTSRPDQIKQLRETILNSAVHGKLVPQDPNDEPAAQLLTRLLIDKAQLVKTGRIRKEKPLPPVDESTVPFVLPAGWIWTRLGDLSRVVTSGSRDWAKFYSNDGAIFVRMGNLSRDSYHLRLSNIQRVKPPADSEGARTRLEEGDILISITGEVGLLGLIPPNFGESYINQHTCLVRPMEPLKNRYLPELFRSPFAQHQFDEPQRGLKNSFRLTDVTHFLVPLPPLAEQRRIVAKVDELMALCDRLEAQLATAQEESSRLLESVLYSALSHIRAESTRQ